MFIRFFYIFEIELFILQKKIFMDRITSFEEYQQEYKKSVDIRKHFGLQKQKSFHGTKSGIKFLNGILKNLP